MEHAPWIPIKYSTKIALRKNEIIIISPAIIVPRTGTLFTSQSTAGYKSDKCKTAIKKVYAAIESGNKEAAQAELVAATKTIQMAGSKGVYHKNNISRKVARISKAVNEMA